MALTTKQIYDLDNSMVAAQNVSLGTVLNDVLFGSIPAPAAGTVTNMSAVSYKTTPAVGSAVAVKAAFALTAGAQTGVTAGITQPDVPRNVTIKGNASGITGNVKIYGTNFADAAISDTIALNGSTEVVGVKAFKTVTAIDFPAEVHAGTDTVSIGRGVKLGFPVALSNAALCPVHNFDGAVDAGTVTAATTVEGSLYAVAGTMDAAKIVELVFLV
jgi:hypothetical protein